MRGDEMELEREKEREEGRGSAGNVVLIAHF